MSKRSAAYGEVIKELKNRIGGIHSKRMRPEEAEDPVNGGEHEEPDGDEGPDGKEPPGPEEESDAGLCPHCGKNLE